MPNMNTIFWRLWLYQTFNTVEKDLLKKVLAAKNFRARAAATRVLSHWLDRVEDPILWLKPMVNDDHPRVRLEAVRALSFLKGDDAIELALNILCLLYTSPSPRDRQKSRMPSSA